MTHATRAKQSKTDKGMGVAVDHTVQNILSKKEFIAGDVSNKFPVPLSDGKTIIFAKSAEDIPYVTAFWEKVINHLNR